MTTCIAAISFDHTIVSASDTKMSFSGDYSVEGVIKSEPFHGEWIAMIGGSDVSQSIPVIEKASKLLRGKGDDFAVVMNGFKDAYQEHRRRVMEDELLSTFDMTLPEFKRTGGKKLQPDIFADLSYQMKNFNLGCAFLIIGYDTKKVPHIFEVRNPGKATVHDKPGFWAIGSGAPAAMSLLAQLGQAREASSLADTIYNVLAAKFSSETASDVGTETFFFLKEYGSYAFSGQGHLKRAMRELWNEVGRPRIPSSVAQIVQDAQVKYWYAPNKARKPKPSTVQRSRLKP